MNYIELRDSTAGKEFIRKDDAKKFTRTQFYFSTSSQEMIMALDGYEGNWIIQDKEGWRNGTFIERKEPVYQ